MKSLDYENTAEILKALGHPVRLKIVCGLIHDNECNVNKMTESLGLPQSTVSQHLSILKSRGIIKDRKEGVRTCYRVVDPMVIDMITVLKR